MFQMTPKQKLSAARLVVTRKLPYFATAMRSLVPVLTHGLGTMAVSEDARMFWDPKFVDKHTPGELAFVLAHELLHVLRLHVRQARALGIQPGGRDARIANIAQDFEINDDLVEVGLDLPTFEVEIDGKSTKKFSGVLASQFGFDNGLTWQDYFQLLRDRVENEGLSGQLAEATEGDRSVPMPGGGDCGSCTGDPHPNEPGGDEDGNEDGEGQGAAGADQDNPNAGKGQDGKGNGEDEPNPADVPGRSEQDLARIRKDAAKQVQAAAQSQGRVPGGWKRWADDLVAVPKIDWRTRLARACRRSFAFVGSGTTPRYDRCNRRQVIHGFGVGKPVLPRMRAPRPRVWVVLDTSGSMGSQEIQDSLAEISGIIQSQRGAEVTFISGDAAVHDVVQARSLSQVMANISGGGGTDFRPPFLLAQRQPKHSKPNVLVYCTDGMGPAPETEPEGIKTIWCLVGPYRTSPATWGECIDLELGAAQ